MPELPEMIVQMPVQNTVKFTFATSFAIIAFPEDKRQRKEEKVCRNRERRKWCARNRFVEKTFIMKSLMECAVLFIYFICFLQ